MRMFQPSLRNSFPVRWWFVGLLLCVATTTTTTFANSNTGVELTLRNLSGSRLGVSWVHPTTQETSLISQMEPQGTTGLNSFVGHLFQIQELPSVNGGSTCNNNNNDSVCQVAYYEIPKDPPPLLVIQPGLELKAIRDDGMSTTAGDRDETSAPPPSPQERLQYCHQQAQQALTRSSNETQVLLDYESCVRSGVYPTLQYAHAEVDFVHDLRVAVANQMENFTCIDPDTESSPDIQVLEWLSPKDDIVRTVHVKLERPASKIHVIQDFASPEECDAMEAVAKPRLQTASTADGKGGVEVSPNRKAMQAGIKPDFSKEANGDLVAKLSRRVYDYTNHVLGLNLTEEGQEPLMSIQYFGKGYSQTEPDRYMPHCDGKCEGLPHKDGARMATTVIYCTIPETGGHTNFQNAGVHVKPSVGSAIFFSYIDPETNTTDFGLTQHSGCPVYEGEKKIITQWVRYGVTKQQSHNSYNTLGILRREDGES